MYIKIHIFQRINMCEVVFLSARKNRDPVSSIMRSKEFGTSNHHRPPTTDRQSSAPKIHENEFHSLIYPCTVIKLNTLKLIGKHPFDLHQPPSPLLVSIPPLPSHHSSSKTSSASSHCFPTTLPHHHCS